MQLSKDLIKRLIDEFPQQIYLFVKNMEKGEVSPIMVFLTVEAAEEGAKGNKAQELLDEIDKLVTSALKKKTARNA